MATRSKIRLAESPADSVPPPPDSGVRESVNRIAAAPVAPRRSPTPPLPTAVLLASPPKLAIRPLAPAVPYTPPAALVVVAPARVVFVAAPEPVAVELRPPPVVSVPVALPSAPITDRLSYAIYSAAELESHIVESQRMIPPPVALPGWPDLRTAGGEAGQGLLSWWRLPRPRPRVMDVCGPQLTTLAKVTKALLATVPWGRLATVTGMVVGVVAVLFFAVVTVGELTDDVKPGKHVESSLAAIATAPVVTAPAPVVVIAAPAPTTFELITATPAAAPKAIKKKRVKRPAPAAGPDRFVP